MARAHHGKLAKGRGRIIQRPAWMMGGRPGTGFGRHGGMVKYVFTRAESNTITLLCGSLPVRDQTQCLRVNHVLGLNPQCSGGVGRNYHGSSCGKRFNW